MTAKIISFETGEEVKPKVKCSFCKNAIPKNKTAFINGKYVLCPKCMVKCDKIISEDR